MNSLKRKVLVSERYDDPNAEVFREMQSRKTNRSRTLFENDNGDKLIKLFDDWWIVSSLRHQFDGRVYLVKKADNV